MVELPLFDKDGRRKGTVSIDETVFGTAVKKKLLREVVVAYEANKRVGTASTKRRGEVEGSTRKPWVQKHTGRARSGTIRSPIWRKGGIVFGPHPRDYRVKLNKKMRQGALDSALLGKIRDQEMVVIEGFEFSEPSTRRMAAIFKNIGIERTCLIGVHNGDPKNVWLSARNLPRVTMEDTQNFNAYDVIRHQRVLLTRAALDFFVARHREHGEKSVKEEIEVATT